MPNTFHDLYVGHNNHAITSNPDDVATGYANIAARDADFAFNTDSLNINKTVRVALPEIEIFILLSVSPTVWSPGLFGTASNEWTELLDTPSSISPNLVVQGNLAGDALEFGQALRTGDTPEFTRLGINQVADGTTPLSISSDLGGQVLDLVSPVGALAAPALRFFELRGNGLNNVSLLSPFTLSADYTIEFPPLPADGPNQLLVYQISASAVTGAYTQNPTIGGKLTVSGSVSSVSLDLTSTLGAFRPNRLTTTERDALTALAGMQIFNTTTNQAETFNGTSWVGQSGFDEWTELLDTPGTISAELVVQGNIGGTALEFGQNLKTNGNPTFADLTITGFFKDSSGDVGTSGQVLASTVTGTNWENRVKIFPTPIINEIAIWTNGDTIKGVPQFTFDGMTFTVKGGALFQSTTDSLTAFQILDADGGTPIFNVDTINERVGIKTAAPVSALHIKGTTVKFEGDALTIDASFEDGTFINLGDKGAVGINDEGSVFMGRNCFWDSFTNKFRRTLAATAQVIIFDGLNGQLQLGVATTGAVGSEFIFLRAMRMQDTGKVSFISSPDSIDAFRVENAAATAVLVVDTLNNRVGILQPLPSVTLDVLGSGIFSGDLELNGAFKDSSGDVGIIGQVLSSTVTGTDWISGGGNVNNTGVPLNNQLAIWTDAITIEGLADLTFASSALTVVGDVISKGTSWTSRTSAADNGWLGVTYGNGLFVAVSDTGTGNRIMTSPDGVNWTLRTSPADNDWFCPIYGNGLFVVVANTGTGDRVMTSPDGINWTLRTSAADNQWRALIYGNNLFVAVADSGTGDRVMTSPDGINWTLRTSAADNRWLGVAFGNGLFVAVAATGTGNRVMTSPDGINWTIRTSAANNGWLGVTYGNGLFVAVSFDGLGNRVMTSPDGITWTIRTSAADNNWISVIYGTGLFVAVASTGTGDRIMTSSNGIDWVSRTNPVDNQWVFVTYGNGLFVAVSNTGTGDRVMTSGKTEINEVPDNNIFQGGLEVRGKLFAAGSFAVKRLATATSFNTDEEVIIGVTDTTVGRTITMTSADIAISGLKIIKDESGAASNPNPITIDTEGSETIDGLASVQIKIPYGVVRLYSDGSNLFSW